MLQQSARGGHMLHPQQQVTGLSMFLTLTCHWQGQRVREHSPDTAGSLSHLPWRLKAAQGVARCHASSEVNAAPVWAVHKT